MKKSWLFFFFLCSFCVRGQVSPGNVGPQPSAYSRRLLAFPNAQAWQQELVTPVTTVYAPGTNVTFSLMNGQTFINASGGSNSLSAYVSNNVVYSFGSLYTNTNNYPMSVTQIFSFTEAAGQVNQVLFQINGGFSYNLATFNNTNLAVGSGTNIVLMPATFFVPASSTFELSTTGNGTVSTITGQITGFY
jgi:hypothetical protein